MIRLRSVLVVGHQGLRPAGSTELGGQTLTWKVQISNAHRVSESSQAVRYEPQHDVQQDVVNATLCCSKQPLHCEFELCDSVTDRQCARKLSKPIQYRPHDKHLFCVSQTVHDQSTCMIGNRNPGQIQTWCDMCLCEWQANLFLFSRPFEMNS